MLLNDYWINKEIKGEIKNTWRQIKMKYNIQKSIGYSKSGTKRTWQQYRPTLRNYKHLKQSNLKKKNNKAQSK